MTVATAKGNKVEVLVSESGQAGLPGLNGTDGAGFNSVRKSLLDNPLMHVLKKNKLVDTLNGVLSWVRSTTGTYIDAYGVLKTAGVNEARQESSGWLIEGVGTNKALYSEDFTNTSWYGSTTVTADVSSAPDKTMTADKIDDTSALDKQFLVQDVSFASDSINTFSVFLKQGTALKTSISIISPNIAFYTVTLDWDDLSLSGSGSLTSTLTTLDDGWVRLSLTTLSTTGVGVGSVRIYPADSGSPESSIGDVLVWGAQLEDLPIKSSYIKTEAAPSTRTADIVSFDIQYDHRETSSIFLSVSLIEGLNKLNSIAYLYKLSGTPFSQSEFKANSANLQFNAYTTAIPTLPISPSKNNIALITDIESSIVKIAINDNELSDTSLGDKPALGVSPMYIGSNNGANSIYGHISGFRVYDFALNDSEIEFLSGV